MTYENYCDLMSSTYCMHGTGGFWLDDFAGRRRRSRLFPRVENKRQRHRRRRHQHKHLEMCNGRGTADDGHSEDGQVGKSMVI